MSTRRVASNSSALYLIAFIVIIVAFFLLGGWPWLQGLLHTSNSMGMATRHGYYGIHHTMSFRLAYWNWPQILISFGLGFLLGIIVTHGRR